MKFVSPLLSLSAVVVIASLSGSTQVNATPLLRQGQVSDPSGNQRALLEDAAESEPPLLQGSPGTKPSLLERGPPFRWPIQSPDLETTDKPLLVNAADDETTVVGKIAGALRRLKRWCKISERYFCGNY